MKNTEPRRTRRKAFLSTQVPDPWFGSASVSSVVNDFRLVLFALVPAFALLASCTVGPNYVRPTADTYVMVGAYASQPFPGGGRSG